MIGHLAAAGARCQLGLRGRHAVGGEQRSRHLPKRALRAVRGWAHRAAGHRAHGHDKAWRNVRWSRRTSRVDAESGADRHPAGTDVSPKVALRRSSADGAGRVTCEPHLAVAVDPDRGGAETTHRDAGLVECGDTRQQ